MSVTCQCPHCGKPIELSVVGVKSDWPRKREDRDRGPLTPEQARAYPMPFGKHKGSTLGEIGLKDPAYIQWVATTCEDPARQAARAYLDSTSPAQAPPVNAQAASPPVVPPVDPGFSEFERGIGGAWREADRTPLGPV